jgi:hypothetical protein
MPRCIDAFPAQAAPLSFHRRHLRQGAARKPNPRSAEPFALPTLPDEGCCEGQSLCAPWSRNQLRSGLAQNPGDLADGSPIDLS